jgi:hypothetical protein
MKKVLLSLFLGFGFMAACLAQDKLYLRNQEIIECEIIEVGLSNISYAPWKRDQPVYNISVSLVDSIIYNTGIGEYFHKKMQGTPNKSGSVDSSNKNINATYQEGFADGLSQPIKGNLEIQGCASGFCCGLVGIITPIAVSTNANSKVPYEKQLTNSPYNQGYSNGVKSSVRLKVWSGYVGGITALSALYFLLVLGL